MMFKGLSNSARNINALPVVKWQTIVPKNIQVKGPKAMNIGRVSIVGQRRFLLWRWKICIVDPGG